MTTKRLIAAAGLLAIAALGGCQGHGQYVSKGITDANNKVEGLKAGNAYQQAQQAFFTGDLEKASKLIDNSITRNPNVAQSHVLKGRIMIEQGNLEGALAALQQAEAVDPKSVEAQYYQGIVFEQFAQSDEALARYQKACELEPSNAQYVVAAAEMMVDLDRLDEAEVFLTTRKTSFEHNAGVRQTLGHVAMMKGDASKAVTLFNEARLLAPDDTGVLEDLVHAQIATGKFAEAEFNLAKLLKAPGNQERRDLKMMRARCMAEVDRPVEAREILLELTSDDAGQKDAEAWIGLGHISYVLRDMNRLRMASQRAIVLAPAQPDGYMLKAMWQRQTNNLQGAIESLDQAARFAGKSTDALLLRGMILEDMGQRDMAHQSFAAALELDPTNELALRAVEATTVHTSVPESGDN